MQDRVADFVKKIRWRNIRNTVVGLLLLVFYALDLYWRAQSNLMTVGKAIVILWILVVLAVTWGKLHIPAAELSAFPPTEHPDRWKRHMTVQARLLRLAWLYFLPLLAGFALIHVGSPGWSGGPYDVPSAVFGVVILVIFAGVAWSTVRAAKSLERDRDTWFGPQSVA